MSLKICSWNIEWFNHLFNTDNTFKTGSSERERFDAIKKVLTVIDPDFLGIVEAPNTLKSGIQSTVIQLEKFAAEYGLRITKAITGYISGGTQEIAVLYDPVKLTLAHDPGGRSGSKSNPPFDGEFLFDTNDDNIKEVYKHYRPPLEVKVKINSTAKEFNAIVAHTKSKGIFDSTDLMHWERTSMRNRLKLYAECQWIRNRVDEWLDDNKHVVVMGDFNDGPGMDFYEFKYGRSAAEIIMGDIFHPDKILRNYAGKPKWTAYGWEPASARFKDKFTEDYVNVLIDHILVSKNLNVMPGSHKIWNPYENDEAKPFKHDLRTASDHFPVSIELDI